MASSQGYHEREELLPARTKDFHRAIVSLQEELEAIDWYQQRVDAVEDPELREILQHNRDEEIEHATMVLEWLRRHDPVFKKQLALRTNHEGPIVGEEHEDASDAGPEGRAGKPKPEKPR
jgi:ferritin-like protein